MQLPKGCILENCYLPKEAYQGTAVKRKHPAEESDGDNETDNIEEEKPFDRYDIESFQLSVVPKERDFSIDLNEVSTRIANSSESLDLSYQYLTDLPQEVCNLSTLTNLNLHYNSLQRLNVTSLIHLKSLNVRTNLLKEAPLITPINQLVYLDISCNDLADCEIKFYILTHLTHLNLIKTNRTILPSDIGMCTNLVHLNIQSNKFHYLPPSFGNLIHLQKLKLGRNSLLKLPDTFSLLTNLTYLDLSDNQLTSVPGSLTTLQLLKKLSLRKNLLTELSEEIITCWTSLIKLDLSQNHLILLSGLNELTALVKLELGMNLLQNIPPINKLTRLAHLELIDNPLCEPLSTLSNAGNQKILVDCLDFIVGRTNCWTSNKPPHSFHLSEEVSRCIIYLTLS